MSSRVLAGLLVAACVAAASGGGYLAVRQNAVQPVPVAASPAPPAGIAPGSPASAAGPPVSETEAVVTGGTPAKPQAEAEPAAPSAPVHPAVSPVRDTPRPSSPAARRESTPPSTSKPRQATPQAPSPSVIAEKPVVSTPATPQAERVQEPARTLDPLPPAPKVPQFEEVVLPASSVIGLEVDTALSSERARVEDRVDARVSRDVMAEGHVVIPAGSRVIGSVTMVERGGKVKTPARLGVRFHTLVLADGREVPLRTEPIYRDGESPGPDSARKIGGAAVGGAILGAIIGGGKGAAIGGAAGAAGGSAIVMAGDRNAATLSPGAVVNVHLSAPVTLEVEKRDQQ
jgi:Bacterial conjugation TrbI-like protein